MIVRIKHKTGQWQHGCGVSLRCALFVLCVFVLLTTQGCRPSDVLSTGKMVDVIVDLHKTEAIIQTAGLNYGHEEESRAYYAQVLDKHGITQAEFDSSMMWYAAHPSFFQRVYPRVLKRLEEEETIEMARLDRLEEEQRIADSLRVVHEEWLRLIKSRTIEEMTDRALFGLPTDKFYQRPTYHVEMFTDTLYQRQAQAREETRRDSLEKACRDSVIAVMGDSIRLHYVDSLLRQSKSELVAGTTSSTLAQRARLLGKKERNWLDSLVIAQTASADSLMRENAQIAHEKAMEEQKKREKEEKMIQKFARFKKM